MALSPERRSDYRRHDRGRDDRSPRRHRDRSPRKHRDYSPPRRYGRDGRDDRDGRDYRDRSPRRRHRDRSPRSHRPSGGGRSYDQKNRHRSYRDHDPYRRQRSPPKRDRSPRKHHSDGHASDRDQYERRSMDSDGSLFSRKQRSRDRNSSGEHSPAEAKKKIEKELPCFEPSGILQEYYGKKKNGVILKFSEPLDADVPNPEQGDLEWCLFEFKGKDLLSDKPMCLEGASAFLLGKDPKVCDFPMLNPSISMQHCVIQFRTKYYTRQLTFEEQQERGDFQTTVQEREVRPYLIDLNSSNGTFLNGDKIEPARYYELLEKDSIQLGMSTREYVVMYK